MASTDQILTAARELGQLIAQHDAAKKLEATLKQLETDTEAQRLLTDYNRQLERIAEKEAGGQPIEVEDKRKLGELQKKVVTHPVLRDFQMRQMDYVDLMRRVDDAMTGAAGPAPSPMGPVGAEPR